MRNSGLFKDKVFPLLCQAQQILILLIFPNGLIVLPLFFLQLGQLPLELVIGLLQRIVPERAVILVLYPARHGGRQAAERSGQHPQHVRYGVSAQNEGAHRQHSRQQHRGDENE